MLGKMKAEKRFMLRNIALTVHLTNRPFSSYSDATSHVHLIGTYHKTNINELQVSKNEYSSFLVLLQRSYLKAVNTVNLSLVEYGQPCTGAIIFGVASSFLLSSFLNQCRHSVNNIEKACQLLWCQAIRQVFDFIDKLFSRQAHSVKIPLLLP